MAAIASTEKVVCPYCGATGVVRIWSCGCQGVSHDEHKENCSRPGAFFDDFWRDCGKSGNVRDHKLSLEFHMANIKTIISCQTLKEYIATEIMSITLIS